MREKARQVAALMAQLSNENRLLILCALLERPMTVGELAENVPGISAPAISQHLHRLREGGLVNCEKQGQFVRCSIGDERLRTLIETLRELYCPAD